MSVLLRVITLFALWSSAGGALRWMAHADEPLPPLSVPLKSFARLASVGYENVFADALFLQFIQHFGGSMRERRQVQQAAPALELLTDLDPKFFGAYVLGTMALGDAKELDAADRLWQKAWLWSPADWRVPYQAGMTMFLFGREAAHALKAAEWFNRAARLPGSPEEARYMEARMYQEGDRKKLAVAAWLNIYRYDPRPTARAVARKTLIEWGVSLP
ncbi:MAG: hypothetical protein VKN33_07830 [Candidatus Sericytochromatia bacterium]|nr:hypothetical protein [Candidatus Sericytochromatia bacterium]